MFDVRIYNNTLPVERFNVSFPGADEKGLEGCPSIPAIAVDGDILLSINELMYAITNYKHARHGINFIHIRDTVKHFAGFGKVFVFKRGGIFTDLAAAASILTKILDNSPAACAYSHVVYADRLEALLSCDTAKYRTLKPARKSILDSKIMQPIVPSTLDVSRNGVFGVPVKADKEAEDVDVAAFSKNEGCVAVHPIEDEDEEPNVGVLKEDIKLDSVAGSTAFDALTKVISALTSGKKLSITVTVALD